MVMDMDMAMAMEMGSMSQPKTQMPTTQMTMSIDCKDVSPEGSLDYAFTYDDIEVIASPGVDPATIPMMRQQMAPLVGMTGSGTVSSLGRSEGAELEIPEGLSPQLKQTLEGMTQSMDQMTAPLPEEAVGVGARWKVTMPMEMNGMKLTQIATYEILERDGDSVKFDIAIEQSAPKQEIQPPGLPPGTTVTLESLDTKSTGVIALQLTSLVPTSEMNLTTENVISAEGQEFKTTIDAEVRIHP
jgi:hypothetical protein